MGEALIVRKNNMNGTSASFAIIAVTYPSGSTCTCSNGNITLTDSNTNGQVIFNIPSTGTWTVTATDGTDSVSESVSITAEGQFASVELTFALVLYNNGTQNVTWAGYDNGGHSDAKLNSAYMSIKPCGYMPYVYTVDKINTEGYSTLCVEYKSKYTRDNGFSFGTSEYVYIGQHWNVSFVSKKSVLDQSETKKIERLPITSGSFNIVIQSGYEDAEYGDSAYIYIYKVWLE